MDNVLEDNNTYYLNDDIDYESSEKVIKFLVEKNFKIKKPDHINLIVNTCGGETNHTLAIVDTINSISIPVHTYGIGQIYSSGVIIICSGRRGFRHLFPNCSIMMHDWWQDVETVKKDEYKARQKEDKLLTDRIVNHFMKYTGKTKIQVKKLFCSRLDHYFSIDEAIKAGLADFICTKFPY